MVYPFQCILSQYLREEIHVSSSFPLNHLHKAQRTWSKVLQLSGGSCFPERDRTIIPQVAVVAEKWLSDISPNSSITPGFRGRWKYDRSPWDKLISKWMEERCSSQRRCSKLSTYMEAKMSVKDQKKNPLCYLKDLSHGTLVPHLQLNSVPVCQRKAGKWILFQSQLRNELFLAMTGEPPQEFVLIQTQWLKGKQGKQLQLPCAIVILNCWN